MSGLIIILWIVFAAIVGKAAEKRRRSFGGWFFLSLLISPILAGIGVLLADYKEVDGISQEEKKE